MATRPKNPASTGAINPDVPPPLTVMPDDDVGDDAWRVMAELGEQSEKILLHRRYPNGRYGFVTEFTPSEFSLTRVRDSYGGGDYIVQFVDVRNRQVGKTPITIDMQPEPPKPEIAPVVSGNGHSGFEGLREILDRQTELIKALVERQIAPPQQDPFEMAMRLTELVNAGRGASPIAEMASLFTTGVELGRSASGEGSDGLMGMAEKFAPAINRVLEMATQQDARRGPPRALRPGPAPTGPATATISETPPVPAFEGPSWVLHLQPHLPMLLNWAKAGKDPALYAEFLLDNIDPGAEMEIAKAAKEDDFVEKTLVALPMFKPYSAWATRILEEMKLLLLQEEPPKDAATAS